MQKNLCCCVDAALRSCGDNISGFRKHEFASALRQEALPPRCILTDQAQNGQGTLPHQSDVAIPQSVDRAKLEPTSLLQSVATKPATSGIPRPHNVFVPSCAHAMQLAASQNAVYLTGLLFRFSVSWEQAAYERSSSCCQILDHGHQLPMPG